MASTRRATIVGINYYEKAPALHGCVKDAYSINAALERHSDGTINFDTDLITADGSASAISRKQLKDEIKDLFSQQYEIALFYFAGHGYVESTGGFLITSECSYGDDGISTNELMDMVNESPSTNKIIILDCCHSGIAGNRSLKDDKAVLNKGVTVLTGSSKDQYAMEENGAGIFTALLVDALNGGAANLLGDITPGSVYAHIDQSLAAKQQRPFFKTNVSMFTSLRKVQPPIALNDLKAIVRLFPEKGADFKLNPSFEPESQFPIKENTEDFALLQKYNRLNLVVPVDAPHMWHAAMQEKSCKLTILGEHYWDLVKKKRI